MPPVSMAASVDVQMQPIRLGWAGVAGGVGGVRARRQLLSCRCRPPRPWPWRAGVGLWAGGCVAGFAPGFEAGGGFWGEPGQDAVGVGRSGCLADEHRLRCGTRRGRWRGRPLRCGCRRGRGCRCGCPRGCGCGRGPGRGCGRPPGRGCGCGRGCGAARRPGCGPGSRPRCGCHRGPGRGRGRGSGGGVEADAAGGFGVGRPSRGG